MTDGEHLINRVVSAWNSHDPGLVTALHAPESIVLDVGLAAPARGTDAIRARARTFIDGIAGLRLTARAPLASGSRVAYEWRVRGDHGGELLGIPATDRSIDVPGATVFDLDGEGLIISERLYWNVATLLGQIGEMP